MLFFFPNQIKIRGTFFGVKNKEKNLLSREVDYLNILSINTIIIDLQYIRILQKAENTKKLSFINNENGQKINIIIWLQQYIALKMEFFFTILSHQIFFLFYCFIICILYTEQICDFFKDDCTFSDFLSLQWPC